MAFLHSLLGRRLHWPQEQLSNLPGIGRRWLLGERQNQLADVPVIFNIFVSEGVAFILLTTCNSRCAKINRAATMTKAQGRLLGLAAIVAAWALCAFAEPVSKLHPTGYVDDFAQVLDANTKAQIEDIAQQIDQKAHAQIAVVTVHSLDGEDIESYAVDLFKSWGIGAKKTDRGVLILYAIQDRRARIEVGYGLEPILPDGKVGSFQREGVVLMRNGEYSKALLLVTSRVALVIAQDAGVQMTGTLTSPPSEEPAPHGELSAGEILLIVIVALIVLAIPPLRRLVFWILFSMIFSGRGSSSGGGGGFGGGGFGGFGGGSSGGGGASSSW